MLDQIVSGAGSGLLGGLVGAVGGVFTKFLEIRKLKVMNDLEMYRMDHDLKSQEVAARMAKDEADAALRVKHVEQEMGEYAADTEALVASYKHDSSLAVMDASQPIAVQYLFGVVNAIRALIRPGLTIMAAFYFVRLYGSLTLKLNEIDREQATAVIVASYGNAANAAIFLTMTTVTWWFSSRTKTYTAFRNEKE